jgi:hypothetical protein
LADHEHGFAMGISAAAEEGDIRSEGNVSGDLLPGEMKVVNAEPHVFAAARNCVGTFCCVVLRGTGMERGSDVLVTLEDANLLRRRSRGDGEHGKGSEFC